MKQRQVASIAEDFLRKRAKVDAVVLPLSIDVIEKLSLDQTKVAPSHRFQAPSLCVEGKRAYLKLGTWLDLKFGVDARVWDKGGSFEDVTAAPSHPENARLNVTLSGDSLRLLEALDRKLEALFAPLTDVAVTWQSLVKRTEKSPHAHAVIKVNFVLRHGSNVQSATEFKLRQTRGALTNGVGWVFLEGNMAACDGFRNGSCKALLDIQYWCMNGAAGVTLNAAAVALRPSAECAAQELFRIDDVFPDGEV
jgi:hypothetical protein